uniref:Uncharacterized protein n=1 Tax=Arundo donax TaxID=35708 RepID=A0A0A9H8B6_ARUDO
MLIIHNNPLLLEKS